MGQLRPRKVVTSVIQPELRLQLTTHPRVNEHILGRKCGWRRGKEGAPCGQGRMVFGRLESRAWGSFPFSDRTGKFMKGRCHETSWKPASCLKNILELTYQSCPCFYPPICSSIHPFMLPSTHPFITRSCIHPPTHLSSHPIQSASQHLYSEKQNMPT